MKLYIKEFYKNSPMKITWSKNDASYERDTIYVNKINEGCGFHVYRKDKNYLYLDVAGDKNYRYLDVAEDYFFNKNVILNKYELDLLGNVIETYVKTGKKIIVI